MGRVWKREIIAIRCDVRACAACVPVSPVLPASSTWHDQVTQLLDLVQQGWAFVLTTPLRAFCPEHAARAEACTCRTHPTRKHLCVVHAAEPAGLVWVSSRTPEIVESFLEVV